MVDKTPEAFGMTVKEMKEANRQAAEQMLPMPYDIPGEVGPVEEDRFGDTAARAAKDSWEEAKARFQSRGTEEGVAGAIPEADSSVLNTFAAGLGYAADMGLSGLAASDAAWRYSVGLASELIPGMDNSQEQRFTRDVSSIPEAFAGNVTGVVGSIDRLPDLRKATAGSRAPNSRPSAVIRRDDQFRGEGNMPLSYTPGRTPADFAEQFAIRTTKQDQIDDIIESGLIRQKVDGYGLKKKSTLYFGLQDTPETKAGIMPGQLTASQPYALVAKADEAAKYDNKGGIPLDALQHIWTMRDGQMVDILPEVLQANRNFKPTNPQSFNEGGLAMERQMNTMMAEGGIKDSGMNRDPISGNEIPAGSLAKEVRDDVDAKLSEGEYVVPADVVRYFGVNYFEKLRQKAKAGLEEMDRDGRIGGDPVGEPMGDMDEALSDEEMFALNEMFKGGMVSGYAPGGDVTANQSQLPANEFQLPSSIFAPTPATAPVATPTTLYGPSGDVMVLMLPAEQERYNQLISEGYSTKPIEAPTAGGEDTGSNRDRDRSAITAPQVGSGEGGFNFSLGEDESKALSDDPLAFGKGALGGDRLLSSRTLAGVGTLGGLPGMVIGGGIGAILELQDVAKARAGLIQARSKGLEGTPEFLALEKEIEEKEKGMNFATKLLDRPELFSGQGYVDSLQDLIGVQTRGAIPTGGTNRRTNDAGIDTARAMTPAQIQAGQENAARGEDREGGQVYANQNKPDTDRSSEEVLAEAQRAADRGGRELAKKGRATGGLVQRPKKKPVAKK